MHLVASVGVVEPPRSRWPAPLLHAYDEGTSSTLCGITLDLLVRFESMDFETVEDVRTCCVRCRALAAADTASLPAITPVRPAVRAGAAGPPEGR